MARPFIKWAGGKSKLLKDLRKYTPKTFTDYYEPFLGGAALYFSMTPERSFLSDSNQELITTYRVLKEDLANLIKELQTYPNTEEFFYQMRVEKPTSSIKIAARFIYLNKTCYNGLYRVNSKGEFNTPYGKYKDPMICDIQTFTLASRALQKAVLSCQSFTDSLAGNFDKDAFIYLDPPYVPVAQDSFVSYSESGFNIDCQEKLAGFFETLPCKVMLSNSDTEWVRDRYKKFNIVEVKSARSINSKGGGRGKVSELIIRNY